MEESADDTGYEQLMEVLLLVTTGRNGDTGLSGNDGGVDPISFSGLHIRDVTLGLDGIRAGTVLI